MKDEIWRDVKGYEGKYQVSNLGRVRSLNYRKTGNVWVMKAKVDRCGYLYVDLWKDGKAKTYRVHRLVAEAFIPNPLGLPCVNHKDECKTNNTTFDDGNGGNLEWCDHIYNMRYGTCIKRRAEKQTNRPDCSKRVYQYTRDGSFIRSYPSAHEAQRRTGINHRRVSECCNSIRNSVYGYVWSYNPPTPTQTRVLF